MGALVPARIVVTLRTESGRPSQPPPHTGPAVAAAFLLAIKKIDPRTAAQLHDEPPPKRYTTTPLLGEDGAPARLASTETRFEVGVLTDSLFAPIYTALTADEPWRIDRVAYQRAATDIRAVVTYPDLLSQARPESRWAFRRVTPTGFSTAKEQGVRRSRPLPDPERIFGSLLARWRALADTPLPETLPSTIAHHLEIVDCELTVAKHLVKPGAPLARGCRGTVSVALAEPERVPPGDRRALDALAAFAAFAGLGDRTTVGMGHAVRLTQPPQAEHRRSGATRRDVRQGLVAVPTPGR